jgi:hypothetical protein
MSYTEEDIRQINDIERGPELTCNWCEANAAHERRRAGYSGGAGR